MPRGRFYSGREMSNQFRSDRRVATPPCRNHCTSYLLLLSTLKHIYHTFTTFSKTIKSHSQPSKTLSLLVTRHWWHSGLFLDTCLPRAFVHVGQVESFYFLAQYGLRIVPKILLLYHVICLISNMFLLGTTCMVQAGNKPVLNQFLSHTTTCFAPFLSLIYIMQINHYVLYILQNAI